MNLAPCPPLLAAGGFDLIEAVIVIVVMFMGALGHLLNSKPKPKGPPVRPRPANPPNPQAPAGKGGQPLSLEETLRREVEEFMRRAQGRDPAASQGAAPQRPAPPPTRKPAARPAKPAIAERSQPPRRLTESSRPASPAPASAPPRSAPLGAGVSQHVAQHMSGTQVLATHAQHLGDQVAAADERMETHLHQKFTHQVGALQHQDAVPQRSVARSPAAQALVDLLRQGGARQLILASEILRRPEDRWNRGDR